MTESMLAASRTLLALVPKTSRVEPLSGTPPLVGTRPNVVLMPTSACAPAGFWMEPPVSSAVPMVAKLAEVAVAVPLLLPPGARSWTTALYVGPKKLVLALAPLRANDGRLVLPRITAPAARRRATIGASALAIM